MAEPTWLLPGERIHAEITADAWRYVALDVPYDRRTILVGGPLGFLCSGLASAIGNRRARRSAEALAAPQWRYLGHLPLIVTSRRLLVEHGAAWWPIWFDHIQRLDPFNKGVIFSFWNDPPYLLVAPVQVPNRPGSLVGRGSTTSAAATAILDAFAQEASGCTPQHRTTELATRST